MRKLLTMLIIAFMLVGCASSNDTEKTAGKKVDSNIKVEEKDRESKDEKEKADNEKKAIANVDDEKEETVKNNSGTKNVSDNTTISKDESKNSQGTSGKGETSNKQDKPSSGTSNDAKPSQPSDASKPTTPVETPPPVEEKPAPPTNQQAKADQVLAQINAYRQQNGKEPFITSDFLRTRSEEHALAMAEAEALWHSGNAAECITNYDDPFSAWINSPAHNKILLTNNSQAAVGIYYYNGYYYSVFQTRV